MRLIDADELMEHVGRDRLDSRELIAKMIENAPTINVDVYKPCPWCGGQATLNIESLKGLIRFGGAHRYYVWCSNCFAEAPNGVFSDINIEPNIAKQNAINAWNKRAGE